MNSFTKVIDLISIENLFNSKKDKENALDLIDYLNSVAPKFNNEFDTFLNKKNVDLMSTLDELHELAGAIKKKDYDLFLCASKMQDLINSAEKNSTIMSTLCSFIAHHPKVVDDAMYKQNYTALRKFIYSEWAKIQLQITSDLIEKINNIVIPTTSNMIILANANHYLEEKHWEFDEFLNLKLYKTINSKLEQLDINKKILPAYDALYIKSLAKEKIQNETSCDVQISQDDYYDILQKVRNNLIMDYYCEIFNSPDSSANYLVGMLYDNLRRKTQKEKDLEYYEGTNLIMEHEKELPIILNQALYGTKKKEKDLEY